MSGYENYELLIKQAVSLFENESDWLANCANLSALLYQGLPDVSWAGFYYYHADCNQLVLGPFQGSVACTRIDLNRGVCGHAATIRKAVVVDDVHQFPDHIACDATAASEVVVPLLQRRGGSTELLGVLDIDSRHKARFNETDAGYLQIIVDNLLTAVSHCERM